MIVYRDPIVEEVRKARAKLWEECGNDVDRVFESMRKSAQEHPERLIGPEEFARRYGTAEQRLPPLPQDEPDDAEARRAS